MKTIVKYNSTTLNVIATLTENMLGTTPKQRDIYSRFVEQAKEKHQAKYGNLSDDEIKEIEANNVDEREEQGWSGFLKDENGYFIYNYPILGMLREAGNTLSGTTVEVDDKVIKMPLQLKAKLMRFVSIQPRQLYLPFTEEDFETDEQKRQNIKYVCERPARVQTPRGERSCLIKSDYLPAGRQLKFQIKLYDLKEINANHLLAILDYASKQQGLGAWRGSGAMGRFEFEYDKTVHKLAKAD